MSDQQPCRTENQRLHEQLVYNRWSSLAYALMFGVFTAIMTGILFSNVEAICK